jgi:hypothetical protein
MVVKRLSVVLFGGAVLAAACGNEVSGDNAGAAPVVSEAPSEVDDVSLPVEDLPAADATDDAPAAEEPSDGALAADEGTGDDPAESDPPALDMSGESVTVNWAATNPTYIPDAGGADDPFFQIHTSNEVDGFYLNFELFTVWGSAWTGETGTFPIGCNDPVNDTGICVHFVPDSEEGVNLGADFGATGTITINQLDATGYDLVVSGLTFSDGTTFEDFSMVG